MEDSKINKLKLNLDNYSGPLDVLLELAKAQKVNLADISITHLADQFLDFINNAKQLNLDLATEYLVMATWLAYLKSKLLLPEVEDDEFKASEVAEKLKLQLKKLELIRLLSDQLLKKKRIGVDVFFRGNPEGVRSINSLKYSTSLFEILKSYSNTKMQQNFLRINISKLPVFTTEEGIKRIQKSFSRLNNWTEITKFIPSEFLSRKKMRKTGMAGIFAASLELAKEGTLDIMQKKLFSQLLIKKKQ